MTYTNIDVDPNEHPNTARALRALKEDFEIERIQYGQYAVRSGSGNIYGIAAHDQYCTCPDEGADLCKHLHALVIEFGPHIINGCDLCGEDLECFDHFGSKPLTGREHTH